MKSTKLKSLLILFSFTQLCLSNYAQVYDKPENFIYIYDVAFKHPHPKRLDIIDSIWDVFYTNKPLKEDFNFRLTVRELAAKKYNDKKCILVNKLRRLNFNQEFFTPVTQNEYEKNYLKFMEEAEQLQFDEMKVTATFFYSIFLNGMYKKDALSLYYNNKCYQLLQQSKFIRPHVLGQIYYTMAERCYKYAIYNQALFFATKAQQYYLHQDFVLFNLNLAGMCCLKLKKYDSALHFFNSDLLHYNKFFDNKGRYDGWIGILQGNKGLVYKETAKLDSAIYCLQFAINDTYKFNLLDNTCGFASHLADIFLHKGQIAEAEKYIQLAVTTTKTAGNENDHFELHQLLVNFYKLKGNFNKALLHRDSLQFWADSINVRMGKNVQIQAELAIETEKKQQIEAALKQNIIQQKTNNIITFVIFTLVAVITVMLVVRQKIINKLKQNKLLLQQEALEKQLIIEQAKAKEEQLTAKLKLQEFTHIIIDKNKQIEELLSKSNQSHNEESIKQLQNNTILTDEQWQNFKELFDTVHHGFIQRLKEKIPEISPAEIRFLALAKLQLSTKEMASSLGVSANAIRNIWYRLRKKISFTDTDNWKTLVEEI
ncbi:MAG: helix-turn-helix transcriptional regulator [Chitinophagaceae bacterium]